MKGPFADRVAVIGWPDSWQKFHAHGSLDERRDPQTHAVSDAFMAINSRHGVHADGEFAGASLDT